MLSREFQKMANSEGYGKIIISSLMGAALGITVTYTTGVSSNKIEIVRLATQIESLNISITAGMIDRYKGADALRDFSLIGEQINNIRRQDQELDAELKEHIRQHDK